MKAAYEALAVLIPMVIIISAVALAFMPSSTENADDPYDPVTPEEPQPDPVPEFPNGITYIESSNTLLSESVVTWHVFDDLHAYSVNGEVYEGYDSESDRVILTPGRYTVTVNDESFGITVPGKVSRSLEWDYVFNGEKYSVSVSYDIDIEEYVEINDRSKTYNQDLHHYFVDLPSLVTVNDTVRDIVSQLEKRFLEIGGSTDDRQEYADFLVSMAQIPIDYPYYGYSYGDMRIWGIEEYWQNTMETLYHTVGDCEDKSALACALFIAAGYDAAMCGVPGHVVAGVALDDFKVRTSDELEAFGMDYWVYAADTAVLEDSDMLYYAVETIKTEQHYIGYLQKGSADCIGTKTLHWGMAGFYPVHV